jgi:hypothetical protein
MSLGPATQRFTFFVRHRNPTDERPWSAMVHAEESCARWRGSRAAIHEVTALGDTLAEAARDCLRAQEAVGSTAKICPRCIPRS